MRPGTQAWKRREREAFGLSSGDTTVLRWLAGGGTLVSWRLPDSRHWRFELRERDTHAIQDVPEQTVAYLARRGVIAGRIVDADHIDYRITDVGRQAVTS